MKLESSAGMLHMCSGSRILLSPLQQPQGDCSREGAARTRCYSQYTRYRRCPTFLHPVPSSTVEAQDQTGAHALVAGQPLEGGSPLRCGWLRVGSASSASHGPAATILATLQWLLDPNWCHPRLPGRLSVFGSVIMHVVLRDKIENQRWINWD
eukprot:SAG31_NODE_403_length_16150_cov_12.566588_7_plen_153_part_00